MALNGLGRKLIEASCSVFGVTHDALVSPSHAWHLVRARAAVVYLLRESGASYSQIGRILGARHHTTAMNALRRAARDYLHDPSFAAQVDLVRSAAYSLAPPAQQSIARVQTEKQRIIAHIDALRRRTLLARAALERLERELADLTRQLETDEQEHP